MIEATAETENLRGRGQRLIWEMPHFELFKQYQANPNLNVEETTYCKLVDSVITAYRKKTGRAWVHNLKFIIHSGKERCLQVLRLYDEISLTKKIEPIDVKATHDGNYIILNGAHRAAIAKILGLKTVPVKIRSVDPELLQLINMLRRHYVPGKKILYIPIEHPVFKDWKALRNKTRWLLVQKEFDWKEKTVVDIGCFTGYFSHKAAQLGAEVTGIEFRPERVEMARRINELLKLNANFIHGDFFKYLKGRKVDCVIFFSVLHGLLKNKGMAGAKQALDLISSSSPVMFFDMGQSNEPKMRSKVWNPLGLTLNKDTIPDLVLSNSKYRHFKHLGTGDTGRDVFKFVL